MRRWRAIAESGLKLHAWARRPESLQNLATVTFSSYRDVRELGANSDAVLLCLTDDRDIWGILETHGLVKMLKAGAVVVNHGTGDPGDNTRISGYLSEKACQFPDAPVSGAGPAAVARPLTTIVGGEKSGFDLCRLVFDTFSRKTVYGGLSGAGQLAKLSNIALTMSNLQKRKRGFPAWQAISFREKAASNASAPLNLPMPMLPTHRNT